MGIFFCECVCDQKSFSRSHKVFTKYPTSHGKSLFRSAHLFSLCIHLVPNVSFSEKRRRQLLIYLNLLRDLLEPLQIETQFLLSGAMAILLGLSQCANYACYGFASTNFLGHIKYLPTHIAYKYALPSPKFPTKDEIEDEYCLQLASDTPLPWDRYKDDSSESRASHAIIDKISDGMIDEAAKEIAVATYTPEGLNERKSPPLSYCSCLGN